MSGSNTSVSLHHLVYHASAGILAGSEPANHRWKFVTDGVADVLACRIQSSVVHVVDIHDGTLHQLIIVVIIPITTCGDLGSPQYVENHEAEHQELQETVNVGSVVLPTLSMMIEYYLCFVSSLQIGTDAHPGRQLAHQ